MAETLGSASYIIILLGFCAGILSGLLGVGSGIVLVPVLVLIFYFPQKSAQGTALAVMVPMALVGALRYWMNPDIEINPAFVGLLVVGALVGALLGTELARILPGHVLRRIFAVFVLAAGVRMLIVSKNPGPTPASANIIDSGNYEVVKKGGGNDESE